MWFNEIRVNKYNITESKQLILFITHNIDTSSINWTQYKVEQSTLSKRLICALLQENYAFHFNQSGFFSIAPPYIQSVPIRFYNGENACLRRLQRIEFFMFSQTKTLEISMEKECGREGCGVAWGDQFYFDSFACGFHWKVCPLYRVTASAHRCKNTLHRRQKNQCKTKSGSPIEWNRECIHGMAWDRQEKKVFKSVHILSIVNAHHQCQLKRISGFSLIYAVNMECHAWAKNYFFLCYLQYVVYWYCLFSLSLVFFLTASIYSKSTNNLK